MTETLSTFPDPDLPTNILDSGIERMKTYAEMTYIYKKISDEVICQNLKKKDVYKSDMHKIYNLIVGQTDEQLQDKTVSDAAFQAVKTDWEPICHLMVFKRICF